MPPKKEIKQKKNRPTNLFLPVEQETAGPVDKQQHEIL
jgi:hypothetical protein